MSFDSEPSAEQMAEWFSKVELHKDMKHERYVGGLVAFENYQTKKWNPYPLAAVRVAYFWDWVEAQGYVATVTNKPPTILELPFKPGEEPERYSYAPALYIETTVTVYKPSEDGSSGGTIVRQATARKTVEPGVSRGPRNNKRKVPDFDAVMKAETGALARACAMIGMLALPGSGVASAEDIHEFMREASDDASGAFEDAPEAGAGDAPQPAARGGRAANPKRAVPAAADA